ncbi:MAG: hypothetical protein PVF91_09800, partial [Chromatiales bacterium]
MILRQAAVLFVLAAATLVAPVAGGDQMIKRILQDGSLVRIDPLTGKARVLTPRGAEAMLWDGVHKLRDGSTIIVRDGVVVPDKPIIGARRGLPESPPGEAASACTNLAGRVCGPGGECADAEACRLAKELAEFERRDREAGRLDAAERTAAQCGQALEDTGAFPQCARADAETLPSIECRTLAERVCGPASRCADTPGCRAARQLIELERDEYLAGPGPDNRLKTTRQCREAASDTSFFAPCTD